MSKRQSVLNGICKSFQNGEYGQMNTYKEFKCDYIYVYRLISITNCIHFKTLYNRLRKSTEILLIHGTGLIKNNNNNYSCMI
jgi:hypothetical protein